MTQPHTILVVEDEASIASFVALYLKNAGYQVKAVGTGSAALNQVAAGMPSMIILDLNLPDMDGIEICRRIRKSSDVPILMLTARDEDVDKIIGLEVGADDYLTKPFNPRELVARIIVEAKLWATKSGAGAIDATTRTGDQLGYYLKHESERAAGEVHPQRVQVAEAGEHRHPRWSIRQDEHGRGADQREDPPPGERADHAPDLAVVGDLRKRRQLRMGQELVGCRGFFDCGHDSSVQGSRQPPYAATS